MEENRKGGNSGSSVFAMTTERRGYGSVNQQAFFFTNMDVHNK